MPARQLKKLAEESGHTIEFAEKCWKTAKGEALKQFPEDDKRYWPVVVTITKSCLGHPDSKK